MLEKACQDIVLEGAERAVQACPRSRQLDGDLARDACVEDGRARSCVKLHASLSNRRRCLRRGICWRCRAPLVVGRRAREDLPSAQSILPQMVFLRAVGSISFPPAEYGRCAASEAVAGSPIVAYAIALPFSLPGALFGGLPGPLGVRPLCRTPLAPAVGISFAIQAIMARRPRLGTDEPTRGCQGPPTGRKAIDPR